MSGELYSDQLLRISSLADLQASLPPLLTRQLGEGEQGKEQLVDLLRNLRPMAPAPAIFDRAAFNAIVAFDRSNQPLTPDEASQWFEVALQSGVIKPAEQREGYYTIDPAIRALLERIFKE